jgi:hypothetical protein
MWQKESRSEAEWGGGSVGIGRERDFFLRVTFTF